MFNVIECLYLKQKNNMVYKDSISNSYTRAYYDRVMKKKYQPIACYVYYFDVNNLKKINDTLGHSYGNELLRSVCNEIMSYKQIKELSRIHGDEFVAISFCKENIKLKNASVGVYKKEKYEDLSSAVHKADLNMYKNKEASKSQ